MSVRILMATVAALALTLPAVAQDEAAPSDTEQQMEQGAQEAPEGATEQAPAMTEEQPAEEGQAPTMTEEQPAEGQAPTTAEEPSAEEPPAMAEEPGTTDPTEADEAPVMTEEAPTDQPAEQAAEAQPPAGMEFLEVQEEEQFLANDEVIGAEVVNEAGEQVGSIADLVMDQDQKLVGVVLSVGGFLGVGDKWVAVPVEQISFPGPEEPAQLLAPVTEEQLTNAPDFTTREALEAEQAAQTQGQGTGTTAPLPTTPPAQ